MTVYDKEQRRAYQREYARKRIQERREYILLALGGKCAKCGSTDNLEVDHIDPNTKEFKIADSWSMAIKRVNEELAKCQLLCDECHNKKSKHDIGSKNRGKRYFVTFLPLTAIEDILTKTLTEREYSRKHGISRTIVRRIQAGDWQRYIKQ